MKKTMRTLISMSMAAVLLLQGCGGQRKAEEAFVPKYDKDSDCIDVEKCMEEITDEYDSIIMRFFEGDVPMMFATGDVVSGTAKRESKSDELYSSLAEIPADRSFSDKETGLLEPAVRQFRAAIYAVGNGNMTVDEAVQAYGSIPEE